MRSRADIRCLLAGVALTACAQLAGAEPDRRDKGSGACVGVGDVVQVSIFESADGISSGNFVTLPSQTVGPRGTFSVPFAGEINAAGRSLPEIRLEIEAKLANRVIAPRALVTLIEQNSNCTSDP